MITPASAWFQLSHRREAFTLLELLIVLVLLALMALLSAPLAVNRGSVVFRKTATEAVAEACREAVTTRTHVVRSFGIGDTAYPIACSSSGVAVHDLPGVR
jgi:prepilin-type N-terminal cleavage/methylation domain-containing protein